MRTTVSGRLAAFCHAGLGQENKSLAGLEKWLRSLSSWPATQPPTYWQMANSLLDWYDPRIGDANAVLSLAANVAGLADDAWIGEVLLAMACYRIGLYENAIVNLERAEELRIQSGAILYPEQLAYTAMTHYQLGRMQEAKKALDKLRDLFRHETSHDDFQPLVAAEKVFAEENQTLSAVWDHIERGYLEKALELLLAAKQSAPPLYSQINADVRSAEFQLAQRFAARALAYEQRSEYRMALSAFESAVAAAKWHAEMLNLLARFNATCPEAAFRDGIRAIANATKACELSHWNNDHHIDTLAAAYAEAGRFEQAIERQQEAIAKLPEDVRPGLRAHYEAKLRLYQTGQSYHGQYLLAGKLIARYSFDKVSGKTVSDSSGNKIDGTLVGNARVVDDPVRGKVLELDGDGDWVDCGDDLLFGMTEEISLSAWFKVAGSIRLWRAVIAKGTSWKLQGRYETLKFVCGVNMPGDIGVDSGVLGKKAINDGHWHHVVGVYDGRTATLYIDGQRDVSAAVAGSIAANSYNVWIGSDSHRNERALKGRIDNVHIYSYALSPNEVKMLYEGKEPPREKISD
jgi:tetratricopeptide (TPR) repeat protein